MSNESRSSSTVAWKTVVFTALRLALGLLWGWMAIRFWSPGFDSHLHHYHDVALSSQPGMLMPWFGMWVGIMSIAADFFAGFGRLAATLVALCLLLGFARRTVYILAIVLSIPLWPLADGFLLPHSFSAFGLSSVLIYFLLFMVLMHADRLAIPQWPGIDDLILGQWRGWRWFCGFGPRQDAAASPGVGRPGFAQRSLTWLLAAVFAVLISGVANSLHLGHPESPSPFQVGDHGLVADPRPVALPPLAGEGDTVEIHLEALVSRIRIASGVSYNGNTFNDTTPGPVIHVRQGQTVKIRFTNRDPLMPHSIDLHSARISPTRAFASARYGETVEFSFRAEVPGAFLYHCSTNPVLLHMANGMYGAIIIDPIEPLPKVDAEYVLVQSEWYTQHVSGSSMMADYRKMVTDQADLVVFNGIAFQYRDNPLPVKVGETVRIHLVNAGPNRWSSFHVIGGIFDRVYPHGDMQHVLTNVSAYSVGPGQGSTFDIRFTEPGMYPFMDHNMRNMMLGAEGMFDVH
ncbi:MAG: multicopper oxidase domain-containing protein [Gammaproteobacteria bacterium]|nr:MAG: multicopper oxidase domain-containing protein [Gammaproteobacteria bacterium]